jgi:NDP-sugar pyrophosphorylase family protein
VDYLCGLTDQPAMFNKHLADIFQQYVQSGGAANILETAWTLPIETDIDLLTLNRHLLEEAIDAHILSELPWTVQVIPPVRIDPQVSVGQGAKIGPNVYLERGCSVGHEAIVKNTIVLGQGAIPAGDQVADVIVSTRGRISG